jgi:thiamine pyrophosphokinase
MISFPRCGRTVSAQRAAAVLDWSRCVTDRAFSSCSATSATYRICADGASNRVFDHFKSSSAEQQASLQPHAIIGDLDSMRDEVKQHFETNEQVYMRRDVGQDNTDLEKSIDFVMENLLQAAAAASETEEKHAPVSAPSASVEAITAGAVTQWRSTLVTAQRAALQSKLSAVKGEVPLLVYPAFGGRFDQQMSHVHVALKHALKQQKHSSPLGLTHPLHLLSSGNFVRVLLPNLHHSISLHSSLEAPGHHCGLWPVGADAHDVTTSGLEWNLTHQGMSWGGGIISTSNLLPRKKGDAEGEEPRVVTVKSDVPLVWWTEVQYKGTWKAHH